tara:strand:+ start:526 stop:681 length:156 start_codon:yes stop_codon:yes gene_type:complete
MTKKKSIKLDHKKKTITITRKLNPPSFHAWMMRKVTTENPDYTIIEDIADE